MVLSTEWSQVEVIDLVNDGNGLGFILVGGRSTGVVIKALTPGGVAERDGRLQCGDHLLQIGEVNLRGFSSEQVATVLRQTGAQVRLIVARPIEPTATDFQTLASHAPIIPTKLLSDPEELSRHIFLNPSFATSAGSVSDGCCSAFPPTPDTELADLPLPPIPTELRSSATALAAQRMCPKDLDIIPFSIVSPSPPSSLTKAIGTSALGFNEASTTIPPTTATTATTNNNNLINNNKNNINNNTNTNNIYTNINTINIISNKPTAAATAPTTATIMKSKDHIETVIAGSAIAGTPTNLNVLSASNVSETDRCSTASSDYMDSPETETYEVELRKNVYGLGITVAGYVCQEEDLSGIFVKSIIEGSAAEMSGQIQINDRIVAVDGKTLAGVTNHQAVEILRNTDIEVHLTLERFLRGRKYEHLQVALTEIKGGADTQSQTSLPASPSIATLSWVPPKSDADSIATIGDGAAVIMDFADLPSRDTVESNMSNMFDRSDHSAGDGESVDDDGEDAGDGVDAGVVKWSTATPTSARTPEGKHLTNGTHINGKSNSNINGHDLKLDLMELQKNYNHRSHHHFANGGNDHRINGGVRTTPNKSTAVGVILSPDMLLTTTQITTPTTTAKTMPIAESATAAATAVAVAVAVVDSKNTNISKQSSAVSTPSVESLKVAWKSEFPESEIIVAEINKLSGLGISLEGTVDVECGIEKRPHHYIRSILEDGPVGRQGILKPGDEILQVNEYKLQGLKHIEVVKILKELPTHVKLVCARGPTAPSIINTSQNPEAFETRSLLPGGHQSLQNLLTKAQSESSLYTSSTATLTDQQRSKSLENVSGLALWSGDVTTIEIEKTEQGFGFSILDYQDPLDPEGSVIVIRGLIRGGSAETTNEIFPGDRLVSVGQHTLNGLDLDEAVAILKGMPLGLTKLGICRPLSTSDSNIASPADDGDSPST